MLARLHFPFLKKQKLAEADDTPVQPEFVKSIRAELPQRRNSPALRSSDLVTEEKAIRILKRLVADAVGLGAVEIFIGHPREDRYEFLAEGRRYGGNIHPEVFRRLLAILQAQGRINLSAENGSVPVSVAITRNFRRLVICVSLTLRAQTADRSSLQPQNDQSRPTLSIVPPKLSIPTPTADCKPEPSSTIRLSTEHLTTRVVLLIDDDPRFLLILTKVLESKGFTVLGKQNGREALHALASNEISPDLIICDIHMPVMDGGAFVSQLRSSGSQLPLLMLTSDTDSTVEAELAVLGADAFVRKQSDLRVLLAWCNNLIERRSTQRLGREVRT